LSTSSGEGLEAADKSPARTMKAIYRKEVMSSMKRVTPAKARPLDPQLGIRHAGRADDLIAAVANDDPEQPSKAAEHRIDVERTHYTSTGARYRVTYLGETLIESARDPEFETCRALLAKGVTGTLVTYSPGSSVPRMRVDIAKGAQLMTINNATDGPRIGRYRPHPKSNDQDGAE
jgi:hypothetical protein